MTEALERLTVVVLAYRKRRFNHRLLFGEPVLRIRRGWRRELAAFEPGAVFGYERWEADRHGTQNWSVHVCRAFGPGSVTKVPGISPGAEVLLRAIGRGKVRCLFEALDRLVEDEIVPAALPAARWRRLHNAIETGAQLPGFETSSERARAC